MSMYHAPRECVACVSTSEHGSILTSASLKEDEVAALRIEAENRKNKRTSYKKSRWRRIFVMTSKLERVEREDVGERRMIQWGV